MRAQARRRREWNLIPLPLNRPTAHYRTAVPLVATDWDLVRKKRHINAMEPASDASKILEKGPEYLRKQMELESETKGGMSAVERLAASKPKYVKSQQVVNSTQEPVISLGSGSTSAASSQPSSIQDEDGNADADNKEQACGVQPCLQVRRTSSKKRPDSLLLYRHKCELLRGPANDRKHHITRTLLLGPVQRNAPLQELADVSNQERIATPQGTGTESDRHAGSPQSGRKWDGVRTRHGSATNCVSAATERPGGVLRKRGGLLAVLETEQRSGKSVSRSHSDISSRYSKNFADFDAFFKYCGLQGEVIESLGKENFSARSDDMALNIRSVSVSTSESGFTRSSDESDGLQEDELRGKMRQGTSVIERNARIIKWLYSCKNANEAGKRLRDLD